MITGMFRRTFIQTASGAALAAPAEPIRLGIDSYSIRELRWKAIQLLDYAAGLKLDTIQLSGLGDYESLEPAYLAKVKDHAARLGLSIDAGIGCICPTSQSWSPKMGSPQGYILRGLRVAKAVGATSMRCFMGSSADRRGPLPIEAHMEATVKTFRSVRSEALDLGVKIALENHSGDLQAREVKTIIEQSGPDYVAVCLDSGNPIWAIEDPLLTLELLAPYTVTTHIRDTAIWEHPRGAAAQWVAVGEGSIDYREFIARYRQLCPKAGMQLEIITGRQPLIFPYLEPDFWKAFPKTPAAEFARFLALAKRGRPFTASGPADQRRDLERSLEYCKTVLDVGVNWRG